MTRKCAICQTTLGWVGLLRSAEGLLSVTLPQRSSQEARQLLDIETKNASDSLASFPSLIERLKAYFAGNKVTFPDKLDLSQATPFQRAVWEATKRIHYGETRSYTWVAEQIGKPKAVRAVGQALGKNPLPIIVPCHRVLTKDGKLGGYSGGLETKKHLRHLESAKVSFSRRD